MKRKWPLITAVLLIAVGAFAFFSSGPVEPVYEGKKYSVWLYGTEKNRGDAFRAVGTNALPYLLHELTADDSIFAAKLHEWTPTKVKDFLGMRPAKLRRSRAFCAIVAFSKDAETAVPPLCDLLDDPELSLRAVSLLSYIGPDAKEALPQLHAYKEGLSDPTKIQRVERAVRTIDRKKR